MDREEFLQQLSEYLMGNVSEAERVDSLRYYREYIEGEVRSGKPERQVLDSLGSAYGIARSIIEAKGYDPEARYDYEAYEGDAGEVCDDRDTEAYRQKSFYVSKWKIWALAAVLILIVGMVLALVFHVFFALLPFLVPFLLVLFLVRLLRGRS